METWKVTKRYILGVRLLPLQSERMRLSYDKEGVIVTYRYKGILLEWVVIKPPKKDMDEIIKCLRDGRE